MRYVVIALLMALGCFDPNAAHASGPEERDSLRGLQGVQVLVEDIEKEVQADGVSQDAIRTSAELILRSNGIRVLTPSERLSTPSAPFLYLRVGTVKTKLGIVDFYAFSVTVVPKQVVSLAHRPGQVAIATTWEAQDGVGTLSRQDIRKVSSYVDDQVKEFANDFLAVNPR